MNLPVDVGAALALARAAGLARLDAQLLLAAALQQSRAWLLGHDDEPLSKHLAERIAAQIGQRAAGMPLAYIVGEKEFHGLLLKVTPDTLVPRPDTETLVDWALEILQALPGAPAVVDLGTGSGAIALAIKHRHPAAAVQAVELSAAALAVAQDNAQRLGLALRFHQGDWWQPLAGQRFDLIVSNPPYIAGADPHLPALRFEPINALTPGVDGMKALLILIDGAPDHLRPGGWLLLEHGYDQAEAVAAALRLRGFTEPTLRLDLGGQPRVSGARWLD
jgi:release factor glutamine methyltransferase